MGTCEKTTLIQKQGYEVQLKRTARKKSVGIKIDQGIITLFVPHFVSMAQIHQILDKKHPWIEKKLSQWQAMPKAKEKSYQSGDTFAYLGKEYRLEVEFSLKTQVRLTEQSLIVSLPNLNNRRYHVKKALYLWYKNQAQQEIGARVVYWQAILGVQPKEVRYKLYKSKWGSCNSKDCIDFNWFIICAPLHILDYVVVHELAHLAFFSHSSNFWQEVGNALPNYKACEQWLAFHSHTLFV